VLGVARSAFSAERRSGVLLLELELPLLLLVVLLKREDGGAEGMTSFAASSGFDPITLLLLLVLVPPFPLPLLLLLLLLLSPPGGFEKYGE